MRKIKIGLVVVASVSVIYFILSSMGRMIGTVVDAETGKPIEGAIVLVEWTMTKGLIGLTHTESYKVKEKVTDVNGRFTVYPVLNPFADAPDTTVYKKGYVAWSSRWIFPDHRNRKDFKWGKYVFTMEQFKETYSHNTHVSFIDACINASLSDNYDLKKNIVRAIEWEEQLALQERMRKGKQKN